MKDIKKSAIGLLMIYLVMIFAIIGAVSFTGSKKNTKLAEGFDISAYNIILDVNEDNTIDVTENLTVNFTSSKHGIYSFVPEWLEYTGKNGKTIKRKSIVSNFRAVGELYSVDTVKKKKRIKIGSASTYVGLGEKTYVIKYTYDMGKDPYKGFDELIFHAYGDYWGTEIKNASIEVNMPKSIEGTQVNFFLDKYRETNVNDFVDYYISGNSIYASFNQEKYLRIKNKVLDTSLTIDIELPEGYFVGGSWNYGRSSFIICMIIFLITIWNFIRWIRFGKDLPKKAETVEFYPPDNLSSAEIGYIYGKQSSKKLTISLIISLASKGYIKIDEVRKNRKKEIQITKLHDPSFFNTPNKRIIVEEKISKRKIKVNKLKDFDSNIINNDAKIMMKYLFRNGDEAELTANIDKFLNVKDFLVENGFIEIISDSDVTKYNDSDNNIEQLEIKKNDESDAQKVKLPDLNSLEYSVFNQLFIFDDVVILSEHITFYKAFDYVDESLQCNLKPLIDDRTANKKMFQSILITILTFILFLVSYCFVEDLDPSWNIIYLSSFACIFINVYFTIIMKRRTEYGEEMIAKVKGFRNFLITAEKDKLEALVLENPNYFYNILPYTYVLNISKKWIEKFENIQVPEMDMGSYNFNNTSSLNHLCDDIYRPEPARSSSSSSGCSSCGGGCSSCGGGCSSCGGGGSW